MGPIVIEKFPSRRVSLVVVEQFN